MASKNIIYKVNGKPNKEDIERFNSDENIFYRFQNPHQKLTSRSCSWEMCYSSKQEAIREYKSMGLDPEDAVLDGKSCMLTFEGIYSWICEFDNSDVLLVFQGRDTRETGHDGEYVATYYSKVAVWSVKDVVKYYLDNNKQEAC